MCPDLCFPSVLIFTGLQEARTHKLSVGSVQVNVNPVFALHCGLSCLTMCGG